MTTAPRPTRADFSDVANAVYDGTSAVMLSAESAAGKYPIESVKALDAICSEAEENGEFTALHEYVEEHGMKDTNPIRSSICKAAKNIAQAVGAKAIIVESATGRVARAMVHYRPDCPVIAVATSQLVCCLFCLYAESSVLTGVLWLSWAKKNAHLIQSRNRLWKRHSAQALSKKATRLLCFRQTKPARLQAQIHLM